jgi:hypothetical protein
LPLSLTVFCSDTVSYHFQTFPLAPVINGMLISYCPSNFHAIQIASALTGMLLSYCRSELQTVQSRPC